MRSFIPDRKEKEKPAGEQPAYKLRVWGFIKGINVFMAALERARIMNNICAFVLFLYHI
jgi:hypothetical protein